MRRRAILAAVTIDPKAIREFVAKVRKKRWVRCYYCGKKVPSKEAHFDHVIPLLGRSKRGTHEVGNLAVSCGSCNRSKSNKAIPEWDKDGQQILFL